MAPVETDVLVNVLREGFAAIEERHENKLKLKKAQQEQQQSEFVGNSSNISIMSSDSLAMVTNGCQIVGSVYNESEFEGTGNIERDFPLLYDIQQKGEQPITWNKGDEVKVKGSLKEESENETDDEKPIRLLNIPTVPSISTTEHPLEESTPFNSENKKSETLISEISTNSEMTKSSPVLPTTECEESTESEKKTKKSGFLKRLISHGLSHNDQSHTNQTAQNLSAQESDEGSSTVSDSELAQIREEEEEDSDDNDDDSSLGSGKNEVPTGSDSEADLDSDAIIGSSGSSNSVDSIQSSQIADYDDDYLIESRPSSSSYYLKSSGDDLDDDVDDVPSESYADDYDMDSDDYLSDSDVPADDFSVETSSIVPGNASIYKEEHPISHINFTRSRPGTLSSYRHSRKVPMVRARGQSLSSSRMSLHDQKSTDYQQQIMARSVIRRGLPQSFKASQVRRYNLTKNSKSLMNMLSIGESNKDKSQTHLDFTKRPIKKLQKEEKKDKIAKNDDEISVGSDEVSLPSNEISLASSNSLVSLASPVKLDSGDSIVEEANNMVEPVSNLTALIRKKKLSLTYYGYVKEKKSPSDEVQEISIIIKSVGFTSKSPLKLKINTSVRLVEMIGYALLQVEKKVDSSVTSKCHMEPNYWVAYVADDDGEAEDDFGVLDRTRLVKSYGTDEFVMVEVGEREWKKNEKQTPSPLKVAEAAQDDTNKSAGEEYNQHNRAISAVTIPSPLSVSGDTNQDDESIITNESLRGQIKSQITSSKSSQDKLGPVKNPMVDELSGKMQGPQITISNGIGNPSSLSLYHRWTVWRRQQMSFKGRHSKSLVIDGYQIYVLPFNESKGSWYEAKTISFNVGQIAKIKQSSKVPKYFKIYVDKHYNHVLKKYYLEAKNSKECKEIVNTINGLVRTYRSDLH